MKKSKNYSLNLPEPDDYVIIGDLNFNTEELDRLIKLIHDNLAVLSTDGANLKDLLAKKADLGSTGKVPESQLPDLDIYRDVLMYGAKGNFPATGDERKLYVDKSTGRIYRWTGSEYTEVSNALDLGETSTTAYRGDRGKIAYDHSQSPHAPVDALKRSESYSRAELDSRMNEVKTYSTTIPESEYTREGYLDVFKRNGVVTLKLLGFIGPGSSIRLPVGFRPALNISVPASVSFYDGGGSGASREEYVLYVKVDGSLSMNTSYTSKEYYISFLTTYVAK